jgi:hypothetical protein
MFQENSDAGPNLKGCIAAERAGLAQRQIGRQGDHCSSAGGRQSCLKIFFDPRFHRFSGSFLIFADGFFALSRFAICDAFHPVIYRADLLPDASRFAASNPQTIPRELDLGLKLRPRPCQRSISSAHEPPQLPFPRVTSQALAKPLQRCFHDHMRLGSSQTGFRAGKKLTPSFFTVSHPASGQCCSAT